MFFIIFKWWKYNYFSDPLPPNSTVFTLYTVFFFDVFPKCVDWRSYKTWKYILLCTFSTLLRCARQLPSCKTPNIPKDWSKDKMLFKIGLFQVLCLIENQCFVCFGKLFLKWVYLNVFFKLWTFSFMLFNQIKCWSLPKIWFM